MISNFDNTVHNQNNQNNWASPYAFCNQSMMNINTWTPEEDAKLRALIINFGNNQWKKISTFFPGRTPQECLSHWKQFLQPTTIKGPWSPEEDQLLIQWVRTHGCKQWSMCANLIAGRSGKQCRERWLNSLNPVVKRGKWTEEDQQAIFDRFKRIGCSWSTIAKEIGNRTENSIKNFFYSTIRKLQSDKIGCLVDVYLESYENKDVNKMEEVLNKLKPNLNKLAQEILKFVTASKIEENEVSAKEELLQFLKMKPNQIDRQERAYLTKRKKEIGYIKKEPTKQCVPTDMAYHTEPYNPNLSSPPIENALLPSHQNNIFLNMNSQNNNNLVCENIIKAMPSDFGHPTLNYTNCNLLNNQNIDTNLSKINDLLHSLTSDFLKAPPQPTMNPNQCTNCSMQYHYNQPTPSNVSYIPHCMPNYYYYNNSNTNTNNNVNPQAWYEVQNNPYQNISHKPTNEYENAYTFQGPLQHQINDKSKYGFTVNPNWNGRNPDNLSTILEQLKKMQKIKDLLASKQKPESQQVEGMLYAKLMEIEKYILNSYRMATNDHTPFL